MFLEKDFRYIRHYRFTMRGRKAAAPVLAVVAGKGEYSILDALEQAYAADEAYVATTNGEIVELVDIKSFPKMGAVALLFHRSHPDAADPSYRKKTGRKISVRAANREADEEQSVSAHVIVRTKPHAEGVYDVLFEEIPGLPLSVIQPIFARALNEYKYEFTDKRGREQETHTVLRVQGVKSESVTDALRTGHFGYITLSKPADAPFIDSEDTFKPLDQKMKIRIQQELEPKTWIDVLGKLARNARNDGWDGFQVDLTMDDDRRKTIKVDRGQEGKEILFVRAEQVHIKNTDLPTCSPNVIDAFVKSVLA